MDVVFAREHQPPRVAGGDRAPADDNQASMDGDECSGPPRPPEWQPLVSTRHWTILAHALTDCPKLLDDLRVVLAQLSPSVRSVLMHNVIQALRADEAPARAIWRALAVTGDEIKLCSAAALGRLHALGDDAPLGVLRRIRPEDE